MDVVDGCAPFVLTMTLEYSPDDAESLLGFKPQNGTNYYGLYDFPDKSCYYNIMRGMGTLIVNILTRSIIDDGCAKTGKGLYYSKGNGFREVERLRTTSRG